MKDLSENWFVDGKPAVVAAQVYNDVIQVMQPVIAIGAHNAPLVLELRPERVPALMFNNSWGITVRSMLLDQFRGLRIKAIHGASLRARFDDEFSTRIVHRGSVDDIPRAVGMLKRALAELEA